MKTIIILQISILCSFFSFDIFGQEALPKVGPENGSLLLIGGGGIGEEIFNEFVSLLGGFDSRLVIVPTAQDPGDIDISYIQEQWENLGFDSISVLHTTHRTVANSNEFISVLKNAKGIWFTGGRQWRLVDAYMNTKAFDEFHKLLERGGVIAGSSAGASIQASFLVRGAEAGNNLVIAPELEHREGFGFLKKCGVDQHIDTRDRWTDLYEVINYDPTLLGIGLCESTAIVVKGDTLEVFGSKNVTFHSYDLLSNCTSEPCYVLLEKGDRLCINPDNLTSIHINNLVKGIEVFPNPADHTVEIRKNGLLKDFREYTILDLNGKVLKKERMENEIIDVSNLNSGFYFLMLRTDREIISKKILIK